MRKLHPLIRWHLDSKEMHHIKRLRLQGCMQTEISRLLNISRNTIAKALRRMQMPTKPVCPEQEILELLQSNVTRKDVAKELRVSLAAVKRVGKKYHTKYRPDPLRFKRDKIEIAIRTRRAPAVAIAREYKVPYRRVLHLAHVIHGPGKFVGGLVEPPFASYLPQVQGHIVRPRRMAVEGPC